MCGICGKFNLQSSLPLNKEEVVKMASVITHRGPDDGGYYFDRNIGLGFRRLSIIDLKTGHQPLSNEDDTVWIVFNGEIYNHLELRQQLIAEGHIFKTHTDTETIVHLYEKYGRDCVRHLRGMFGFAIWDSRTRTLFCARDRFGIKPFFYYLNGQQFIFGSEIKCILQDSGVNRQLSIHALDYYLTFGYTQRERSIFEHIKKLPPAHTLEIRAGHEPVFSKYWDIRYQPDHTISEAEWCERIEQKLSESVRMHLMSDVPLGAFLSGGIDSSAVVALMAKHSERPVKTFSIGFRETEFNELPYAREIARAYKTEHHEQIVEPESVGLLPKLIAAYDEPFADASAIPTYYVSKFAREYVKVVLSGDGGDELFAGYDHYPRMKNISTRNLIPEPFSQHFWGAVHSAIPASVKGKGVTYYLSRPKKTVSAHLSIWHRTEREKLYDPTIWEQVETLPAEAEKEAFIHHSTTPDFIFNMQQTDMHTYLVDDILTKVDRVSMLNSLEVRVPILDHEFAELTFSVPSFLKLKGREKKYIFKKAMGKYLPPSVLEHKKQGFGVPLNRWFKKELKEYVQERLIHSKGPLYNYLDNVFVRKVVKDHNNGMRDFDLKIWSLLFLDEWLKQQSI